MKSLVIIAASTAGNAHLIGPAMSAKARPADRNNSQDTQSNETTAR